MKGYTLIELLGAITAFAVFCGMAWILYAAVHFILKFW